MRMIRRGKFALAARTEDSKVMQESNEDLNKEMKALRAELDKKNKREY